MMRWARKTRITGRAVLAAGAAVLVAATLSACATSGQGGDTGNGDPKVDIPGLGESSGGAGTPTLSIEGAEDALGIWSSDEPGHPQLEFREDGSVRGTDGCNGISTTFGVEDGKIVLGSWTSTEMACTGVDDWLRGAREVSVDGAVMRVLNSSGVEIGRLELDPE